MIAPVNRAVTVRAGAVENKPRSGIMRLSRMPCFHVALLAELRFGGDEQRLVIGAVGFMAIGAILHRRRMLPEKRSPLLGMAGITELVHRVGLEQRVGDASMGVVAARAGHLSFPQRHMGGAHQLRFSLNVTLSAGLYFGRLRQLISLRMVVHHSMAYGAGQAAGLMGTPLPMKPRRLLVATKANRITPVDRGGVVF